MTTHSFVPRTPRRRLALRGGLAVCSIALASSVSCRQVLDIKERSLASTEDAGVRTSKKPVTMKCGGFHQASAECGGCLDTKCCNAAKDCAADPLCEPTYGCIRNCAAGDGECVAWCRGSYAGTDTLAALISCASAECADACALECGDLHEGATDCDACARSKCCDESAACAADDDCAAFDLCLGRCLPNGSDACTTDCKNQHPAGANVYAARTACVTSACSDECSSDRSWGCLEHPWPAFRPPTLDDITVEMTVIEYLDATPFANVSVKACVADDRECSSPRGTGITDKDGHFSMQVRTSTTGFDGYLEFTPAGKSDSDLYPALYYFRPSLLVGIKGLLRIPSVNTLQILVGAMQVELDPKRGHLALVPTNCGLNPANGVSFVADTADAQSTPYYFGDSGPSSTLTQTQLEPSLGGFINLPPGVVDVTATAVSQGKVSADMSFIIRAGTLTTTPVPPNR